MVRVAGIKQQLQGVVADLPADGMLPCGAADRHRRAHPPNGRGRVPGVGSARSCPLLAANGLHLRGAATELTPEQTRRDEGLLPVVGLPGAHAPGDRPGPPLPPPAQQVAEPGGGGAPHRSPQEEGARASRRWRWCRCPACCPAWCRCREAPRRPSSCSRSSSSCTRPICFPATRWSRRRPSA